MRFVFALAVLIALMASPAIAQDLTTDKGKLSYAVGWDIGKDIERRGAEFDVETLLQILYLPQSGSVFPTTNLGKCSVLARKVYLTRKKR